MIVEGSSVRVEASVLLVESLKQIEEDALNGALNGALNDAL